jgi:hypothetical protein
VIQSLNKGVARLGGHVKYSAFGQTIPCGHDTPNKKNDKHTKGGRGSRSKPVGEQVRLTTYPPRLDTSSIALLVRLYHVAYSTLTSHAHTRDYTTHHTNLTASHVIDLVVFYFGAAGAGPEYVWRNLMETIMAEGN